MRIAAFGDIHSNHFALEACLEDAQRQGIDGVAFLGDYVSDFPCPEKTLALIRETAAKLPTWMIRGNREEYLLRHAQNPGENWRRGSRSGSLLYTYEHLAGEDLRAFEQMPIAMTVRVDGMESFEVCHGAPWQSRWMLLPDTPEGDEVLHSMQTRLLLCAHTHQTFVYERDGKSIVNGGAVGFPEKGDTRAGYVLLESMNGRWRVRNRRVQYDVEAELREFDESGFVDWGNVWARAVAACLRTGRDYLKECLRSVDQDARRTGLTADCEMLWEKAAESLGI